MTSKTKLEKFLMNMVFQKYDEMNTFWRIREKAIGSHGIKRLWSIFKYYRYMQHFCASIPLSTSIKEMPTFPHGLNGIFISSAAKIGKGCVIFHQVTIGSNSIANTKKPGAPEIGDNVFIGAGAKIIGGVAVGNNVRIGANCIVTEDIPDDCTVILTHPRIIKRTN